MKWSWRIAKIAGIGIYMHATFLILVAWIAVTFYAQGGSVLHALYGLLYIGALFGIVVLHELGHALTARRFGIRTRDITLLPIGGLARLERMPEDPKHELLVALAGPAVNVAVALVVSAVAIPLYGVASLADADLVGGNFLASMILVNVILAGFNLLPAFPMDGGRVLRALLAMRMDYVRATQWAATVGQAMALLFGLVGLLWPNPFLIFIALFVWMGAGQEASMAMMRSAMSGIPVGRAMVTEYHTLAPSDSLQQAIDYILAGFQQDFPVVEGGRVVGVLTQSGLLAALAKRSRDTLVEEVMQRQFETADPAEMLDNVFSRLQSRGCRSLPVVREGRLVGIMTMTNLGEFLTIRALLHGKRT
jgi:Zn-dependent protease/CBS domain-containing protein